MSCGLAVTEIASSQGSLPALCSYPDCALRATSGAAGPPTCAAGSCRWRSRMSPACRSASELVTGAVVVAALAVMAYAQDGKDTPPPKPSTLPNPYRLVPDWPTLPASMKGPHGHKWGEVIRVHLAPDGHVWVFQRCFNDRPAGDATCLNRGDANPPILEFDPAGRLLKSFGVGLFAHPHGFTVDKDGNIWTTDTNDAETILGMPAR